MSKVVLVSESGYDEKHDELLNSFLDQEYELFCVVGKDCELWEEIMDEIAVGDGTNSRYITTTSHPNETELEVVEFAESFTTKIKSAVKIVCI
ncbi:hypothetical protein [Reinekea thalattae]|uniref:Uncharacterized protein n=1 Tax=Reinekea thalattae TaxID=2593301 RepID=A0A5C8Z9E7_9GAMM|nr:hypothetical protein [Reinekea thalattae]TXR53848.1 hypothetical protein FME95_04635 [Reinekea thalattae]